VSRAPEVHPRPPRGKGALLPEEAATLVLIGAVTTCRTSMNEKLTLVQKNNSNQRKTGYGLGSPKKKGKKLQMWTCGAFGDKVMLFLSAI
jgi:hypothetical protein